ncbi:MAG: NAD(+) synthase [Myxococcaceae bacterium]|nr:NAD(+) synthase [Myxococcaceae bacterium]
MRLVKLGVCSVNTTVGAHRSNVDRAIGFAEKLAAEQVTVAAFQEQLIGGYPVEDLVQWQGFVERQWSELLRFASATAHLPTVFVVGVTVALEGLRYNCAAVVAGGRIHGLVPKEKLPTYSVFYEGRTLARGYAGMNERHRGVPMGDLLFRFDFGVLAAEVCEDLWSADGPIRRRSYSGAELVVNLSASPYRVGFTQSRLELIATRAADHQCTLVYSNAVGANDGLIFDGGGYVNQNGRYLLEAPRFVEGFSTVTVDLDRSTRQRAENTTWRDDCERWLKHHPRVPIIDVTGFTSRRDGLRYPVPAHRSFFLPPDRPPANPRAEFCEEILDALALGVGDYFEKTGAFKKFGIALSGGRDSLLTLLVVHRYAKRVRPDDPGSLIDAFYMPSRYSSPQTRAAAELIAKELGVHLTIVSIDEAFEREREAALKMLGPGATITPITEQNIQARLRAQRMWNWSNSANGLFVQTGNMSEKAVGYTTVGGDLMGAVAVIANVPKTVVMYLLDYLAETTGYQGIQAVLQKPPGPELAFDQVGEEELMPFPVLDGCFYLFAAEKLLPDEVLAAMRELFPEIPEATMRGYVQKFVRLFVQSIYKWVQSPLSLHIWNLDLERERALQLPVVTRPDWRN